MTAHTDTAAGAPSPWKGTAGKLVSYRYLGCNSVVIDDEYATGHMPLRSAMRRGAGLLATPLAVAMLDTAGISVDGIRVAAPTHISVQIHDDAPDVTSVQVDGFVTPLARRALFTEAVLRDAADPERVVATGAVDWASMAETPPGWTYGEPGPGAPDEPPMPPLVDAYLVEDSATGYRIAALGPEVGTRVLHHGPQMAALEWEGTDAAEQLADGDALALRTFGARLIRGGTRAPFVTRPLDGGRHGDEVWARAVLVDLDGEGEVIAQVTTTSRVLAG